MSLGYVPGIGATSAKILVLTDNPSEDDASKGYNLSGHVGREFDRMLAEAGISRGSCWITSYSKFVVPENFGENKIPWHIRAQNAGIDLVKAISELRTEIAQIEPNVVIALGSPSLYAGTGNTNVDDWRGSILHGFGTKVIGTYHPRNVMFSGGEAGGYWQRPIVIFDLKRAKEQSSFKGIVRPVRSLNVCTSSVQLQDFFNRYRKLGRPSIDIEAHQCIPICFGISYTPSEGITVPIWNHSGYSKMPDFEMLNVWRTLAEEFAISDVIGQNFGYDRDKSKKLGFIFRSLASDTMLKSFAINPEFPKSLAFNTSIYTEEPFYKNEGMYEGSLEDLYVGCARDSCVTKEIDLKMESELHEIGQWEYYYNYILKLHDLYSHIEQQGFHVNEEKREQLIGKYTKWSEQNRYELFKIAGADINVNSPKQVDVFLYESLRIPRRKGTGEEVLTALINGPAKNNDIWKRAITLILEKRRVDKTLGNMLTAPVDFDGRMKTTYFVCLETGRTSTSSLGPPIRPILEFKQDGKKKQKEIGTAFQVMTKHGDIGADVREMLEVDDLETEVFIQADSSQAEARVVALLANDEFALKGYDTHDMHALTASWFFGGDEDDYSKKKLGYETPMRFVGKTLRHAGHLGASEKRAAITVNTDARRFKIDYEISVEDAKVCLKIFHLKTPNIQHVFHAGIVDVLGRKRVLHAARPYGVESKVGGRRMFFERTGEELNRQAFSYIPQRSISDNTKNAGMRLHKIAPHIPIIVESHDALVFRVKLKDVNWFAPHIMEEMQRPLDFSECSLPRHDLVIPCELEVGTNYKSLKKFKFSDFTQYA